MLLDNIIWLAIGFLPMYGAMELSWRLAKRIAAKGNKTRGKEGDNCRVYALKSCISTNKK